MSKIPPPTDPVEALGEAYELLLEKVLDQLHVADPHHKRGEVEDILEQAGTRLAPLQRLDRDTRCQVEDALVRDLHSIARYRQRGGRDVEGWLGFERQKLQGRLLALLPKIADPTTVEWLQQKAEMAAPPYHTGELTGPGTLVCDQCGETLRFTRPGHIPPCPRCQGTRFHRPGDE